MSYPIIRVENLSKKYTVSHQQEGYTTFRDAMTNGVRSLGQALFNRKDYKPRRSNDEDFWALKDVNFEIQQGDRVGIIGRNGAGKSTLLKILSRITEPTNGSIRIKGRVASLLEVGTGFHPELTGRENVFLNGAILGMSKSEIVQKFDEIVAFAEVERFLDTPVKRYSSGMYVRLAFAVAAHMEPEILIVDEVLAVGDAQFQKKCLGKMGEVAQEGRTVLFVSHSMGAISSLCEKVIFLERGQVQEIGSADKVATTYLSKLFDNKIDDISQLRLPGAGKEIWFSDVQFAVRHDTNLNFGEPITLSLTIQSKINVADLILGLSIFSSSGNCVGSLLTEETFSINSKQEVVLHLKILNTNLAPGSYYVGLGIGQQGTQKSFDGVVGKPAFQILPISESKQHSVTNWQSSWGNICFRESELSIQREVHEVINL